MTNVVDEYINKLADIDSYEARNARTSLMMYRNNLIHKKAQVAYVEQDCLKLLKEIIPKILIDDENNK